MSSLDARREQAERLHEEGCTLDRSGDTDGALAKYLAALELDLARPTTHYNVGLIHKYRGAWRESLRYNRRAHELDPQDEASAWNLAIAATALRDWHTARRTWTALGIDVGDGDGPIERNFGRAPVRLNPASDGEVVWGRRLDPVRTRIENVPYARSGFRHLDVVLHDGAPNGTRISNGREYAVFDVLELFEASAYHTYEARAVVADAAELKALEALCDSLGVGFEDWTRSVRVLCRACSEGRAHDHHDTEMTDPPWNPERHLAFAATSDEALDEVLGKHRADGGSALEYERTLDAGD